MSDLTSTVSSLHWRITVLEGDVPDLLKVIDDGSKLAATVAAAASGGIFGILSVAFTVLPQVDQFVSDIEKVVADIKACGVAAAALSTSSSIAKAS